MKNFFCLQGRHPPDPRAEITYRTCQCYYLQYLDLEKKNKLNPYYILFFIILNLLHCASTSGHMLLNFHNLFLAHQLFNIRLKMVVLELRVLKLCTCSQFFIFIFFLALHFYVHNEDDYTHTHSTLFLSHKSRAHAYLDQSLFRYFNQSLFGLTCLVSMLWSLSYKLESCKAATVVSEPINSTLDPMLWYAVIQGSTKGYRVVSRLSFMTEYGSINLNVYQK